MFRYRKGQSWTIDYMMSFVIFILVIFITVKIIVNTFPEDDFEIRKEAASKISSHLVGQGAPILWTASTVKRIGIADEGNRVNDAKLRNYLELDYEDTKNYFGTTSDYAFYFEKNETIEGFRTECALGSPDLSEQKNIYNELLDSAYYHRDDSFALTSMNALGADIYDGRDSDEADSFYTSLDEYDFVLMENPQVTIGGTITPVVKKDRLEDYVEKGGELWLTGNVSTNITGVGFSNSTQRDGTVVNDTDPYFELTAGASIEDDDPFNAVTRVVNINSTNYASLVKLNGTGNDFAARWNYGIGEVYYFSTLEATYDDGITVGMDEKLGNAAENYVNVTKANCTSLDFNSTDSENVAKAERFVVRDGSISRMVVLTW